MRLTSRILGVVSALLLAQALIASPRDLAPGEARYLVTLKGGGQAPDVAALGGPRVVVRHAQARHLNGFP